MLMTETAVLSLKQHLDYNPHRDVVYGIKADKPMNQVLVFVIRGIATKWKQPIAYFFANSCVPSKDVATMLQEALVKIQSTGLNGETGIAQTMMNTINQQCNFSFLFLLHAEHALHLQDSLVRKFVITRIHYYVKFYNRELSPRNKKNDTKMARVLHK